MNNVMNHTSENEVSEASILTPIEDLPEELRAKLLSQIKPVKLIKVPFLSEGRIKELIAQGEIKPFDSAKFLENERVGQEESK